MKSYHGLTADNLKKRTRTNKGGCWLWTGNRHESGYPRATVKSRNYFVHKVMFILANGRVPAGLSVWRDCGNSDCINPAHMRTATRKQIARLMMEKGLFSCGSKHPGSKLTEADVRRIRRLHAAGKRSYKELAADYSVDSTLIVRIVRRERWKQVD